MSNDDRIVKIGSHEIALGGFALLLMLVAILVPAVTYSLRLQDPNPSDLLVAIGVAMFASTLYLWVLDITGTVSFKRSWASKSIYGAAIASILGTSVGVYKDAFLDGPYPFSGEWLVSVTAPNDKTVIARRSVNLSFSSNSNTYWGYGAPPPSGEASTTWLAVTAFDSDQGRIELTLTVPNNDRSVQVIEAELSRQGSTNSYSSADVDGQYRVSISRRN